MKQTTLIALAAAIALSSASQASDLLPPRTSSLGTGMVTGKPEVLALMKPGETFSRTAEGGTATTYQVYIPTTFTPAHPGSLLIGFHPGGSGGAILEALKPSAEKAGWILVGCDKLSNQTEDNSEAHKIEDELLADILASLPHDPKSIYLTGFSGGAERCYHLTSRLKIRFAGILAYGGWLGGPEYQNKRYGYGMKVAIINGKEDKNANGWVAADTAALRRSMCKVKEFPWDGSHSIAPADITDQAIAWIEPQRKKTP